MASPDRTAADRLGGRLPLLAPEDLDDEQRRLYDALSELVVPGAAQGGFTARLDDGRLVGPFNAMLRVPALATALGGWTAQIGAAGLAQEVREAVILTVGAAWGAAYEIDAHRSAARVAGLPEAAIDAILRGEEPSGLGAGAEIAQALVAALLVDRQVPDDVYHRAIERFGVSGLIAILCLVGQYQTISSILVTFEVPVAGRGDAC